MRLALVFLFVANGAYAQLRPLSEVARAQVGADVAAERYGLDGRGTAVCLVDTGVDPTLFDVAYWRDRETTWRAPDLAGVPGDTHGHGTAMASIVRAIAPAAQLFVVSAYDAALGGFPDDRVLDGVRSCREMAAEQGIDLVVLLSLGGHDGPHDGTSAFERALDREAREVPIVVAAGNDGQRAVHATGRLLDERTEIPLYVPRASDPDPELALAVRFDGDVAIRTPSGARSPLSAGLVALQDPESGEYTIELEGRGSFDVWIAWERLGDTFLAARLSGPHAVMSEQVTIPATAEDVIAVGATISRASVGMLTSDGEPGDPAPYSSLGPSASGAPRPDLAAPGGWTLAALSTQVRDGDPRNLVGGSLAPYRADGRIAIRGTSVSAAVVAGALALALQHGEPSADVRSLLCASARGGSWRPDVGFGELDMLALLERWSGARDDLPSSGAITATRAYAPEDGALWIAAITTGIHDLPAGARLRVELGDRAFTAPLVAGTARLAIVPDRAAVGSDLHLEAYADAVPIDGDDVPVVIDRSARGVLLAGGCAVAPGARAPLALLAAILAMLRRRC